MKVLYIGNYRDGTGWGNAAINNILAMDKAGINIVPRPISFEQFDRDYPDRIKELEDNSSYDCDICIQHTLPHLYSYDSSYRNIGFLAVESTSFKDTGWQHYANLMDEIWVPCYESRAACRISGVKKNINVIPHSLDIKKYTEFKNVKTVDKLKNTFNFIFVGEFIERKNIKALLIAFHSEFKNNEPVNLIIKTSKRDSDFVNNYCNDIKRGLKIRKKYRQEVILSGMLTFKDYVSLLKNSNCFVMPSRGEAFCIPLLEAMAVGVPSIYTSNIGVQDYAYGTKVKSNKTQCFGCIDTIPYLDSANSSWYDIDILELRYAMRGQYMKWNTEQEQKEKNEAIKSAFELDHSVVGAKIKDILNDS